MNFLPRLRHLTRPLALASRQATQHNVRWQSTAAMRPTQFATPAASIASGTTSAASDMTSTASTEDAGEPEIVVDNKGMKWEKKVDEQGKTFYYNVETWETMEEKPDTATIDRPKYCTSWEDPKYPNWVQFIETNSMRKYYYNLSNGDVTWAHPSNPEMDVFQEEYKDSNRPLTRVPEDTPNAPISRRLAAAALDFGIVAASAGALGTLFYFEVDSFMSAQVGAGMFGWLGFIGRDMAFENGTRSLGKRYMKLEVVTVDGQLPTRWNTLFRNVSTIPVYLLAGVATELVPPVFLFASLDLGCLMFTKKNMRLGEFVGRTRVISELPDREERMEEKVQRDLEADMEKPRGGMM